MKQKLTLLVFTIIFSLSITACGNGISSKDGSPVSASGSSTLTATPAPYSHKTSLSDFNIVTDASAKIILDCDMSYLNDDAFALFFLLQADKLGYVDLLGISASGGNKPGAVATNATLLQLEKVGRTDIPVYIGRDEPLCGFNPERASKLDYAGDVYTQFDKYVSPENYHNLGDLYHPMWGYSETEAESMSASEFMTEQVKNHPGEITILCIGPATNVALACQADTAFAENTAGIIYMGGKLSDDSSFNWSYDADAVKVCLNSSFPKQTICTGEIADSMQIPPAFWNELASCESTPAAFLTDYKSMASSNRKLSDPVIPAILLCPELIVTSAEETVSVSTSESDYGRMLLTGDGTPATVISQVNGGDIYALMRLLLEK